MLGYLLAFLYFTGPSLAKGTPANTTNPDSCPPFSGTTRSVWNILGTCGITLLICVWHTIHFDLPEKKWQASWWWRILCGIISFFAPEVLVANASVEWWEASNKVNRFRRRGYEWSMTHSFFAEMGGFAYYDGNKSLADEDKLPRIGSLDFLELCERKGIINPFIKARNIQDRSKSDWIGKLILVLQLVWFMLQVIARGSQGLVVTLIELDTVCMGVLSLIVIVLWWEKPLDARHPHVFYSTRVLQWDGSEDGSVPPPETISAEQRKALSAAWKPEPIFFTRRDKPADEETDDEFTTGLPVRSRFSRLVDKLEEDHVTYFALGVAWMVLGWLHLIAWNFEFPTKTEKVLWRGFSFVLAMTPIPCIFFALLYDKVSSGWVKKIADTFDRSSVFLGIVSRMVLVGLMFASLRALPCSAHENVSWAIYIPHLS